MTVATFETRTPKTAALKFSAILAVDKGVPSELVRCPRGYRVVADDGREVRFERPAR